jgi:hypothetical protein
MNYIKILHKLGNEAPGMVLRVIALQCVCNASIRPMITLSNKKESPERKRYAALRESMTEFTAVPVVVGLGFVFKKWLSPFLYEKNSPEINKDVIQKISMVSGVSAGNLMIPFVATAVIGSLFKAFPGMSSKKLPDKVNDSLAEHDAPELSLMSPNPISANVMQKLPSPTAYSTYSSLNPMYRTVSL